MTPNDHTRGEIHHTQLRFSSRPTLESYPRWHYDHKVYLSDHDWRVDAGSAGRALNEDDDARGSRPRVTVSGARGASGRAASSSSAKANTLAFSARQPDALEEYNFTVFKGAQRRKKSETGGHSWWESSSASGRNPPHNLKRGKTISIHGETIYGAVERRARAAEEKQRRQEEFLSFESSGTFLGRRAGSSSGCGILR